MHTLQGRNAHRLAPVALRYIMDHGKGATTPEGSRLELDAPVCITYERPLERVILQEQLFSNPFLLTMKAVWCLAGRDDSNFLAPYDKATPEFITTPGHSWRHLFGHDQLTGILENIKEQPALQVWFPLPAQLMGVDRNLSACFRVVDGQLELTVFNGPTSLIEHMLEEDLYVYSYLLDFVAHVAGIPSGKLHIITNCLYMPATALNLNIADAMERVEDGPCHYEVSKAEPFPVIRTSLNQWIGDLTMLVEQGPGVIGIKENFFRRVVAPMMGAWTTFNLGDVGPAMSLCNEIQDPALAQACRVYLEAVRVAQSRMEKLR